MGERFDVTNVRKEKEDAFVAGVTNRTVLGLDNADSRIPWLEDGLASYATGLRYQLRQFYTTNQEVTYDAYGFLMISSRNPHFKRPDVAERLLPFYFARPEKFIDESTLYAVLAKRRADIWGELLNRLSVITDNLVETKGPAPPFRMADFASFGWRVFHPLGGSGEWVKLLKRLEGAQVSFASEHDSLISALRILIDRDRQIGPGETGLLFKSGTEISEKEELTLPRTSQGFGQKLTSMRHVIELELGVKFTEDSGHAGKRIVTITPASFGWRVFHPLGKLCTSRILSF